MLLKNIIITVSYDENTVKRKKLHRKPGLINIWSARGLSLYGKVTIIKSLIVPKFVYVSSLLTTPRGVIQELNRLIFKFLWKGVDKVTRLSAINDYEKSGLKMIDLETMVKSLRLAWLKRIFSENDGTWKNFLHHALKCYGGSLLFHCNYHVKDLFSQFYTELLQWWAEFQDEFSVEKPWHNIILNNKDIRIDNKPIFYNTFFESRITHVTDLRFDLSITESNNIITKKMTKANILVWAGLRNAVPSDLLSKSKPNNHSFLTMPPSLNIENNVFDIPVKKSKDYYTKLISRKTKFSNSSVNVL